MVYLLFAIAALLLIGLVLLVWRLWSDYAQVGPEEEEREREIAALNDAQANRISDQQLTRPIDADDAWQTMVQRGTPSRRRRRR
jgi:CHASE3 domain sensor protein